MNKSITLNEIMRNVRENPKYEKMITRVHGKRKKELLAISLYNVENEVPISELERLMETNKENLFNVTMRLKENLKNSKYEFLIPSFNSKDAYIILRKKEQETNKEIRTFNSEKINYNQNF